MSLVEIIKTIATLLPVIHQVVLLVEQIFPKAGAGAAKLDAAATMVQSFLPQVGVAADQISAIAGPLKGAISAVVGGLNASGTLANVPSIQQPAVPNTVG